MVRELQDSDIPRLTRWLNEVHGDAVNPKVFSDEGCKALVVEDAEGTVMFVRLAPAWRIDIQFLPAGNPRRTALGVQELVDYGKSNLPAEQFLFETRFPLLARFMRRFGFEHEPNTYILKMKGR